MIKYKSQVIVFWDFRWSIVTRFDTSIFNLTHLTEIDKHDSYRNVDLINYLRSNDLIHKKSKSHPNSEWLLTFYFSFF